MTKLWNAPFRVMALFLILAASLMIVAAIAPTSGAARSQPANGTYDTDGDGLIEISTLEQLDAMRYDRNGNGRTDRSDADVYAAAFPTGGAVCHGCIGYELVRSLDFRDVGSYASGKVNLAWTGGRGWEPISSSRENFGDPAKYIFDGNGHTISNLYISHQGDLIGLFGRSEGIIRQIGLVDVKVSGTGSVGGLVGENYGTIIASYVTGVVVVTGQGNAGGLVGTNGAYRKTGAVISASYSTADVTSNYEAGGLLGDEAGGLAGSNDGLIIASYASGDVTGGFENASGAVWNGATVDARRSANPAATGGLVGRTILAQLYRRQLLGHSNLRPRNGSR